MNPELALSDVIFALKHGTRVAGVDVLERGSDSNGRPYVDIEVETHPYRLILEDHA